MKRMLAAIGLALLLHGALFLVSFEWFSGQTVSPRISQFVTVTMSYRHKALKAESEKKEEIAQQEIAEPRKVEATKPRQKPAIEKLEQMPLASRAAKVEEPRVVADDTISDANRSTKDSGGATGRVQEAVPLYKINPPPRYPRSARRRGIQGTVLLSVHVDVQGRVDNLWVFESSGYRVLDNAALNSVTKWSFEPGRRGDMKIAMWVNVPVRFELQ